MYKIKTMFAKIRNGLGYLAELPAIGLLKFCDWFFNDKEGEEDAQEIMDDMLRKFKEPESYDEYCENIYDILNWHKDTGLLFLNNNKINYRIIADDNEHFNYPMSENDSYRANIFIKNGFIDLIIFG
jgi:hypothetical protein